MLKELVSIVIPVYNGEKYIDRCVKCLLAQTYENIEFIFVNDGSKDNSASMLDAVVQQDKRMQVIHKENGGLCSARNAGIRKATGKYVYFFDVDDEIMPDLIKDNVEYAEEHNADVVMFGFWYKNVDKDEEKENQAERFFAGTGEEYFNQELLSTIEREIFNAPWNKMIRLEFLRQKGLEFDERYPIYEDIIFNSTLLRIAEKVVVNPKPYYKYYIQSSGTLITRFTEGYFASVTQYYKNAMQYCEKFGNNKEQNLALSRVYVVHVYTHLKQISTRKELSQEKKCEMIGNICSNELFREACNKIELKGRKKLIRYMINNNMQRGIIKAYKLIALVK